MENKRQKIEVADIFRQFESDYYRQHALTGEKKKAFNAIINCRTERLGGHTLKCDTCGYIEHSFNSCRNRNCPKCQYLKQVVWVDKLKARLLPVKYFHLVFTVPATLHKLFYANQGICYDLLMRSASQAIIKAGENPAFLGARTGCVAVLHTWGQALTYHPHVHMLVPAGGFDCEMVEWIKSGKNFFAPVKVLSALFRGIFAENIYKHAIDLISPAEEEKVDVNYLRAIIYNTRWNVFAKPALNNASNVIEYLGRYTHRIAISNARIVEICDDKVLFRWKDYRHQGKTKIMKVTGVDFINRFMMHVLPCGFYKIRYYGIFANKISSNLFDRFITFSTCETEFPSLEGKSWQEILLENFGYDPSFCKKCKTGRMIWQIDISTQPRAA